MCCARCRDLPACHQHGLSCWPHASYSQDKEVFLYQLQRRHARRVWLVPFEEFCQVVEDAAQVCVMD